jgi:DNA-directed RNA polymerase subunit beta'
MAVHLPLSVAAQEEAKTLMAATRNLLRPGSGDSIVNPRMDMVLGVYWMTKEIPGEKGEGKYFASPNEAITAYDFGIVSFRAKITVMPSDKEKYAQFGGKPFETTIGRLLFNSVFPSEFPYMNDEVTGKKMNAIIDQVILTYGLETAPSVIDKIKAFGYKYATVSGTTWNIDAVKFLKIKRNLLTKDGIRQRVLMLTMKKGFFQLKNAMNELSKFGRGYVQRSKNLFQNHLKSMVQYTISLPLVLVGLLHR